MNITGGRNLTLYEVQEAADIVAAASHEELNMIFGSVINENLKEEMIVTVIATGFNEPDVTLSQTSPRPSMEERSNPYQREQRVQRGPINRGDRVQDYNQHSEHPEDSLDIPAFLRNRKNRLR